MEAHIRHTLTKKERLCGNNGITNLLKKGKFGSVPGFRYCYMRDNGLEYNRILVSVPKKIFKRAVVRNLLKRRIRESWRLHKHLMKSTGCDILFTYSTKEKMGLKEISQSVISIIEKVDNA